MKKQTIFNLLLLSTILTSCKDYTPNPMDIEDTIDAKEYIDFKKDKIEDKLLVSDGYSNEGNFNCTWNADNTYIENGEMVLQLSGKKDYQSGEIRSKESFLYGSFSTRLKPVKKKGTCTSFFTYTGPYEGNEHDEIDIEFLGQDTRVVQFNYFKAGVGHHEYYYNLGFDASKEYHDYGFKWEKDRITWFVDNKPVYRANKVYLTTPQRIYANLWCGIDHNAWWMGKYRFPGTYKARYQNIKYTPITYSE